MAAKMSGKSMLYSFEYMIQSEVFIFNVGKGKDRKSFSVHSKVVAATSSYFRALVNNGMAESCTKTVEYPDVEPEDFARFVEYAYRNDYRVPAWVRDKTYPKDKTLPVREPTVIEEPKQKDTSPLDQSPSHGWFGQYSSKSRFGQFAPQAGLEDKKTPAYQVVDSVRSGFDKRNYLGTKEPKTFMLAAFEPKHNFAPDQDFTPVFLGHARLYAFACMRGVDPLKRLTLHKLHQTLLGFQLYEQRAGDIVELARYAYTQGEDRRDDGTKDELRQLVLEYVVCEVMLFGKHPAFLDLLQEGGEFVVDFWNLVYKEELGM